MPEKVEDVGEYAFYHCTSVTEAIPLERVGEKSLQRLFLVHASRGVFAYEL